MRAIPCPISKERFEDLYTKQYLTEKQINELLISEGIDSSMKRIGSWRLRYGIETVSKFDRLELPKIEGELRSILIGSMLGDGRIVFRTNASHYEERHAPNQKEYLEWKQEKWGVWSSGDLAVAMSREFPSYIFRTHAHPMLNEYRDLFYEERGKGWKVVKSDVIDQVDELALAMWYLDDGHAGHWPMICFGAKQGSRANAYLIFEKFGLAPNWTHKKGETGEFHFKGENAYRFIEIIKPHVPDCMSYKLDFGFQGRNNAIKKKMNKGILEELRGKGWSKRRIAKYLDVGYNTADRWMRKFGVE